MIVSPEPEDDPITALEAAGYVHQIAGEMAMMASDVGLSTVAAALRLAQELAADKLAAAQSNPGNPAPDEAA